MPTKQQYEQKVHTITIERTQLYRKRKRAIDKIVHKQNALQNIETLISKRYFEIARKRIERYQKRIDIIEWTIYNARMTHMETVAEEMKSNDN